MDAMINVIDEDPNVAEVLVTILESHGYTAQQYLSVDDLFAALPQHSKSISLVSFGLPQRGASRLLAGIQNGTFSTLPVMLSRGVETSTIVDAIKTGAEDVLEKPLLIDELLSVIRHCVSKINDQVSFRPTSAGNLYESLTPEEQAILELMEQGTTIKKIAAKLDISIRTVHYRKKSILMKTECKNRTEAIAKLSSIRSSITSEAV